MTTVTIQLTPETKAWLTNAAAVMRQDLPTFIAGYLDRLAAASTALDRTLDPIRTAFEESGMTDDELGDMLEDAKHAMRAERRAAAAANRG